jgi:hypothetical protein
VLATVCCIEIHFAVLSLINITILWIINWINVSATWVPTGKGLLIMKYVRYTYVHRQTDIFTNEHAKYMRESKFKHYVYA